MKYEIRDASGNTVAIFEDKNTAVVYAASKGLKMVAVKEINEHNIKEEKEWTLPSFLSEAL